MELKTIAIQNASKIAKETKNCPNGQYVCVYLHMGELKIVRLQKSWWVEKESYDFYVPMTKYQVLQTIKTQDDVNQEIYEMQ